MYQGWTGKIDASKEIEKIRELAQRGLENHPDAISLYWSRYKINKEWGDFSDMLRDDPFFDNESNYELYMPLTTLIEITKKAKIKDEEIKQKMVFLKRLQKTKDIRILRS